MTKTVTDPTLNDRRKCPTCGSARIHRASRYSRRDTILSWLNIYPYRCRECPSRQRFYSRGRQ